MGRSKRGGGGGPVGSVGNTSLTTVQSPAGAGGSLGVVLGHHREQNLRKLGGMKGQRGGAGFTSGTQPTCTATSGPGPRQSNGMQAGPQSPVHTGGKLNYVGAGIALHAQQVSGRQTCSGGGRRTRYRRRTRASRRRRTRVRRRRRRGRRTRFRTRWRRGGRRTGPKWGCLS